MSLLPHEAEILGHFHHFLCQCRALFAPTSANQAATNLLQQVVQGNQTMALDLSKLQADVAAAASALQQLPVLRQQVTDLQAKLDAAPHEDPAVQQAVDALDATLNSALNPAAAAPAVPTPAPADAGASAPVAPVADTGAAPDATAPQLVATPAPGA